MSTETAREIRRSISGWLTEQLNNLGMPADSIDFQSFKEVTRSLVLVSLEQVNEQLKQIQKDAIKKFHLNENIELVWFYIKGGNAFRHTVTKEPGTSDWDTQILINPWLPLPLINFLYGVIEDMVLEEFSLVSKRIGVKADELPKDNGLNKYICEFWDKSEDGIPDFNGIPLNTLYSIKLAEQQAIRQVFDHTLSGLWDFNSRPMSKKVFGSDQSPGMIFNDAIKPFVIYRLGYVWRASVREKAELEAEEVNSPILMELIDITIPRKNTVEAIELWEDLKNSITPDTITLDPTILDLQLKKHDQVTLPFPNYHYHASEQLIMLSEVADGSSRHKDKMVKRVNRFVNLWTGLNSGQKLEIQQNLVGTMMGVSDVHAYQIKDAHWLYDTFNHDTAVEQVLAFLNDKVAVDTISIDQRDAMILILKLMDNVHVRSLQNLTLDNPVNHTLLQKIIQSIEILKASLAEHNVLHVNVEKAAFSDDVPLQHTIAENDTIDIKKMRRSGIDVMLVVRTNSKEMVDICAKHYFKILRDGFHVKTTDVKSREHNSTHASGVSYDRTLVIFNDSGEASISIMFTSALSSQRPFLYPYKGNLVQFASLAAMASQRRVCAAMIKDYVIRTALSNQVEMIDSLIET